MIKYLLVLCCWLVPSSALAGFVYYVDANPGMNCSGNYSIANRTCTGSDGNSYTTIGAAENVARAGDIIYIRAGTYTERVTCEYSGSAENGYITFVAYPGEEALTIGHTPRGSEQVVIDGNFDLSNRDYIKIIGLEIKSSMGNNRNAISMSGSDYIEILDNYLHHNEDDSAMISCNPVGCSYVTVRGNYLYYSGCGESGGDCTGNSTGIDISNTNPNPTSSHILIEYNILQRMGDFINNYRTGYSIIRNNHLYDFEPKYWTPLSYALHPDGYQPVGGDGTNYKYNTYEYNFVGSFETTNPLNQPYNGHFFLAREISTNQATDLIIRGNVTYNISSGSVIGSIDYVYMYNNTIYNWLMKADDSNSMIYWYDGGGGTPALGGIFRNNLIHTNDSAPGGTHAIVNVQGGSVCRVNNQLCYNVESTSGGDCRSTMNPLLTDIAGLDFTLSSASSPACNLGMHLTQANGSGTNSTALVVDDTRFFTDGYRITNGDSIIVGNGSAVRIRSINSATSITLAEPRSWSDNDNIVLAQMLDADSADVGALPYRAGGYSLTATYSKSGGTVTVTPSDNDLVRFVVCYENNIPEPPDYDPPFTFSLGSGAVKCNVYALYASTTPVIEAERGAAVKTPSGLKIVPPQ